jgi:uncharacterized membrane protein YgcG
MNMCATVPVLKIAIFIFGALLFCSASATALSGAGRLISVASPSNDVIFVQKRRSMPSAAEIQLMIQSGQLPPQYQHLVPPQYKPMISGSGQTDFQSGFNGSGNPSAGSGGRGGGGGQNGMTNGAGPRR